MLVVSAELTDEMTLNIVLHPDPGQRDGTKKNQAIPFAADSQKSATEGGENICAVLFSWHVPVCTYLTYPACRKRESHSL